MRCKKIKILFSLLVFSAVPLSAQNAQKEPVFMFAPLAEYSLYGADKPCIGTGFSIANDGRAAIGMSAIYYHDVATADYGARIFAIEVTFFLRYYFLDKNCTGLYVQFNGGPMVLFNEDDVSFPEESGSFSAGFMFGWRFPLGKVFYLEPYAKVGYPYMFTGGMSLGFRL